MKRVIGLDFLKFACAFGVICIHAPFPDLIDAVVTPLARIAVPIFFMITGYFYSVTKERNKTIPQLKKIAQIFIFANILYFLFSLQKHWNNINPVSDFLSTYFRVNDILNLLLFNVSPFSHHLWYLGATLYVLSIVFLWEKKRSIDKLYPIIPFLLFTDLLFGKYSLLLLGITIPHIFVRNFLFVGMPYFLIGDILSKNTLAVKKRTLIAASVFFSITTLCERFFLISRNLNAERDHYVSTTFLAICLFLLALLYGNNINNKFYQICCFIGSKLSLLIYILHPMVQQTLPKAIAYLPAPIRAVYNAASRAFIVFGVSIFISWVIHLLKNQILKSKAYP